METVLSHAAVSERCILVVGDVMLDRYVIGNVPRISPEAPVPVLLVERDEARPGGAANVAANVAAIGGNCILLTIAGDDAAADQLEKEVEAFGARVEFIREPTIPTTQKTRIVSGTQQIVRVDREARVPHDAVARLRERFRSLLPDIDVVIFSDYGKGVLREIPAMIAEARAAGKITLVDPKLSTPASYRGASILKPNASEFEKLFGPASSKAEIGKLALAAIAEYGFDHMIVTRGPLGAMVISADGTFHEMPTQAREVFDVSGAGDTMISAIAIAVAAGFDAVTATNFGNLAASIAVSKLGTYVVKAKDIRLRQFEQSPLVGKAVSLYVLLPILEVERLHGHRIVFTNGCFDILHPGHVRYLKAAKELGDILVVGLNSDNSVRGLKGPSRPVNTMADRAEVLAGLSSVDFVVEFDAPTPIDLITAVQPDVLVKGGDYKAEDIVGYDVVTERGGEVITVSFHDGYSTTNIIRKSGSTD